MALVASPGLGALAVSQSRGESKGGCSLGHVRVELVQSRAVPCFLMMSGEWRIRVREGR